MLLHTYICVLLDSNGKHAKQPQKLKQHTALGLKQVLERTETHKEGFITTGINVTMYNTVHTCLIFIS